MARITDLRLLGLTIIACIAYGVANAHADEGCAQTEITFIEDFGAQDTNLDGIATVAEGEYDIDSDNVFTEVEAINLGLCRFIAWGTVGACTESTPFYCLKMTTNPSLAPFVGTCLPDNRYVCVDTNGDGTCDHTRRRP